MKGSRLQLMRMSRALTVEQASELCGVTVSTWKKWELDISGVRARYLYKIIKGLQLSSFEINNLTA